VYETLQPGLKLAVDANRGWTSRDAVLVSQACRDLTLVIEQPCDTLEEIASHHGRLSHPFFLDEFSERLGVVLQSVGQRVYDGFSLKVTHMGGLSSMRTVRYICWEVNLPITCDDAWGGDIVAAACHHIGATVTPRLLEGVWLAAPSIDGHFDPVNGLSIENGRIRVPAGPGLGL
jgi:L-alanine-DL-glutamate epimerase-like enolase superfamily enzyme